MAQKKKYTGKPSEGVQIALGKVMDAFTDGSIGKAAALSVIKPAPGIPSESYSYNNRVIMHLSGTADARGFGAWKKAGRFVDGKDKQIYILAPMIGSKKEDQPDGSVKDASYCYGFKPVVVFRMEDTKGDVPPEYADAIPQDFPDLAGVAEAWGLKVTYAPAAGNYAGYYRPDKEIVLCSKDEEVFLHELAHAAHQRLGKLKDVPKLIQEAVAEIAAHALMHLFGRGANDAHCIDYVNSYAAEEKKDGAKVALTVLKQVGEVMEEILNCPVAPVIPEKKQPKARKAAVGQLGFLFK
jgi:hypothetical protein